MGFLLTTLLSLFAWSLPAKADMHICYFSLNDEQEFAATKELVDQVNAGADEKTTVTEFYPEGTNPNAAFEKMIKSGARCDGLVISGHHTETYGGARTRKKGKPQGRLSLSFLEDLNCKPEYAKFFQGVQATWLQGCRTLGVGEIEAESDQTNANFHTNRVGQVLEEDNLNQTYAELNMEFTNTLDQDNPLASRYLRLLPNSKLFGWTRTAPGQKSESWKSLLFHLAQTSRLMNDGEYPEDPAGFFLSQKSTGQISQALQFLLKPQSDPICEEVATEAWLAQGGVGNPEKFFFDNQDLRAYSSLSSTGDKSLEQARKINCDLKKARDEDNLALMSKTLDQLAANPEFLRYSFNTLVDMRKELAKKKNPLAQTILEKMRQQPNILEFLAKKLASPQVGVIRKIDYYRFQQLLTESSDATLETALNNDVVQELLRPLPALNPQAEHPERSRKLAKDFRNTLFQSFVKNKIAGPDFYQNLLAGKPEMDVLTFMVQQSVRYNKDELTTNLMLIADSDLAGKDAEEVKEYRAAFTQLKKDKVISAQEYKSYNDQIMLRLSGGTSGLF